MSGGNMSEGEMSRGKMSGSRATHPSAIQLILVVLLERRHAERTFTASGDFE